MAPIDADSIGEILSHIPRSSFVTSKEPTVAYRLGIIDNTTYDLVELFPGIVYPPHYHDKAQGHVLFVVGEGTISLDGKEESYSPKQSFYIGPKVGHGFKPTTRTLFLSVQTPPVKDPETGEEDLHF